MAHAAFFIVAALAIGSALGLILKKNAIHGALFLVVNLGAIAALYLMLGAEFLAAAQVIDETAARDRIEPRLESASGLEGVSHAMHRQ